MTGRVWLPRPDQQAALAALDDRQRFLLCSPTGSGKTVLAATKLREWMVDEMSVGRTLVVAPHLVIAGWLAQMLQWRHLHALHDLAPQVIGFQHLDLTPSRKPDGSKGSLEFRDKKATKARLRALPGRLHFCSWDAFPWVEDVLGAGWPYDGLVLDESSFAKDIRSARGRAARRAVHKAGVVEHLQLLSATPAANHQEAWWAQLDLVERGCLGANLTAFREEWCVPATKDWQSGQVYSWKVAPARLAEFDAVIARLAVAMPESIGVDLQLVPQWIDLPAAAREEYRQLKKDQVLDDVTAASMATLHGKLRQLAAGFVYPDDREEHARKVHTAKLERFRELVDSIDGPVLVAYNFAFERSWLQSYGRQFADVTQGDALQRFKAGKLRILGMHPASAGHGLDGLQHVTNQMIWTSPPVDAELFTQANGRLKRGGQDETVFVHVLLARDTVEEDIWTETLPTKEREQARTLAAAMAA